MQLKDWKISTKIIWALLSLVVVFSIASAYQMYSIRRLRLIQQQCAERAGNAISIEGIGRAVERSYSSIADAVINRTPEESKKAFAGLRAAAMHDMETIRALAVTGQDKQWSADFSAQYIKYLDTCEQQLLPLLAQRENPLKRAQDVIVLNDIARKINDLSVATSDAIINGDTAGMAMVLASAKEVCTPLLSAMQRIGDTPEKQGLVLGAQEEYASYLRIIERRFMPALQAKDISPEELRSLDDEMDIDRLRVLVTLDGLTKLIREDLQKAEQQEQQISRLNARLSQDRALCMKPMAGLAESLVKKNAEGNSLYHGLALRNLNTSAAAVVLAIVLSQIIGYFFLRAIRRPVAKAVRMAEDVSIGDLETSIDVQQKDEIGALADTMKTMVGNLKGLVVLAEKIAQGDLSVRVKPLSDRDSLGHALKAMVAKLSGIMAEINAAANNVAAGAGQMTATSQAMSQNATEQASSLEEISSSMNEIAAQTRRNAENATQANRLSGDAKALAEKGNAQVARMVSAMKEINDSGSNISRIIKVIDEIAFQTNLLALNAAVEAARAGRHGKGFAVVAEEVRSLAARSAKAAKETEGLIEDSVKKVAGGTDLADQTAEALQEIVAASAKVTDLVAEIAAASSEQAQGVSQITSGLGHVDQVTQQNTAHAEQSAAAAQELSSQARLLQELVSTFKLSDRRALSGPEEGQSPEHPMLPSDAAADREGQA